VTTQIFTYDAFNRMTSAGGADYFYDANSQRVRKSTQAMHSLYYWNNGQILGEGTGEASGTSVHPAFPCICFVKYSTCVS